MAPKNHKKNKKSKRGITSFPSPSSSSSSSFSSPDNMGDKMSDEYIALAKAVLRCTAYIDELLVDRSDICYMNEFTNDLVIVPPDERFPGCVCFFEPDCHPDVVLNDKKHRQRSGTIVTLKPSPVKMVDFLKTANATGKSVSNKFISSAGMTQTSGILEQSLILLENFYIVSQIPDDTDQKTPEEYFTEVIALRDQFEKTLILTPATPDDIKDIARERCKVRAQTIGEFRMKHKLFNVGYSAMYELFEEFEETIAASLLDRNLDNNKVCQYYVGIQKE